MPFALLGAHVSIERGLAVIAGASEGDLQVDVERLEEALSVDQHLSLAAPEMANLLKQIDVKVGGFMAVSGHGMTPSEEMWSEAEDALAEIELVLNLSQGRPQAPSHLIDGPSTEEFKAEEKKISQPPTDGARFNIDAHVRMAADAKRYRFLRDRERIKDPDEDLLVVRGDNWLSAEELDQEIDTALRVQAMQQQVVQERQP
ncbi:hypothetical protein ACU7AI_23635 [Pseudomonas aeruginosa]